jgi:hypothetical protein
MKATINRAMFEQMAFDSSSPAGTASVVHRFAEPGEYVVTFLADERPFGDVRMTVIDDAPPGVTLSDHVTIDVTALMANTDISEAPPHRNPFLLRPNGYASFSASGRARPYAVVVMPRGYSYGGAAPAAQGAARHGPVFDSRRLGHGDFFALTPLRPGRYRLVNHLNKREGTITVAYPVIGDRPYRPPEPIEVECGQGGFSPSTIALQPAQGLVFKIATEARLTIDLIEPDDGPAYGAKRPRADQSGKP